MGARDPQIAKLAAAQHGVASRSQLRALGLTDTQIRERVRSRRLLRVHRGVYAVGHAALRPEGWMLAAVLCCGPGAILSHRSAAALWGLLATERDRIDVTASGRRGAGARGIDLHRSGALVSRDVTVHRGVPISSVPRTLVDLAGVVRGSTLERALAQAEVLGLYDGAALHEILARSNGRRGARALRGALGAPPALTRSELERAFLSVCDGHGIPRPLVNTIVAGHEVDFFWPEARLVVETDGHIYHRTRRAFEDDRRRDADLMLAGCRVLRLTHTRIVHEAHLVATTVQRLRQAGMAGS